MDRDRQRIHCNEGGDVRKPQEINSNSSFKTKHKKMRGKKRCAYLQEWLDKSCTFDEESEGMYTSETEHNINIMNNPSYWPSHTALPKAHSQGLFTSVSNPTMCHYSVPSMPLGYAIEPVSLPVYAMYPPSMQPAQSWRPGSAQHPPPARDRPQRMPRNISTIPQRLSWNSTHQGVKSVPTTQVPIELLSQPVDPSQDFASLPPLIETHESGSSQRRFSDPGLGPSPVGNEASEPGYVESSDSGDSPCSSSTNAGVVINLVEQVSALRDSNKQLFRELRDTRSELQALKLQAAAWKLPQTEYQPGLLSDLVREVREAARVREEALLARVRHIVGDTHWNPSPPTPAQSLPDLKPTSVQVPVTTDFAAQSNVDERLERIEQHLQSLQLKTSPQNYPPSTASHETRVTPAGAESAHLMPEQLVSLEKEKMQLRYELQEALNSRKVVEVHAQKLERLVGILRKKINGLTAEESALASLDQCPSSLENTSESLASVCSSSAGSTHSPHVTMSGPVTDL